MTQASTLVAGQGDIEPVSRFVSAPDGLKLHVADYCLANSQRIPVVCLSGLSRNGRDFEPLAKRLVSEGHRVIAPDYRGRGLSDWDKDFRRYDIAIEREDVLAVVAALEIGRAAFIGTSRGGLHVMGLAAAKPTLIAGAVLNDIGPIIEPQGLMKIKLRLGARPNPTNWQDAATFLRQTYSAQFPALEQHDWDMFAKSTIREKNERLFWDHDPALARTLDAVGPDMAAIDLWLQFEALAPVPVLAIRGALSDILSADTFSQMQARLPDCKGFEVHNQGHAPMLSDAESLNTIARFVAQLA